MENEEYTKLINFLGKKFGEIDGRFEQVDKRFDALRFELKEDIASNLRQMGVMLEATNHKVDLVIEGQQDIRRDMDGLRQDLSRLEGKAEKRELEFIAHTNDSRAHK
jgi:hypothetical protein